VDLLNVVIKDRQVCFTQSAKQHQHPKHHSIFNLIAQTFAITAQMCFVKRAVNIF